MPSRRGKAELRILGWVSGGEPYRFSYCGAWGQRVYNAACKLRDEGRVTLEYLPKPDGGAAQHVIVRLRPNV
jgi:hypothetical protein